MQFRFKYLLNGQWSEWIEGEQQIWIVLCKLDNSKLEAVKIEETLTVEEFEKSKHYETLFR